MMKTKTKALLMAGCAMLLVLSTVFATVAYLTSTDSVTNTFTVGSVKITMDETDVDTNGVQDGDTRVKVNEYKLMPGRSYTKDPIVHIDSKSENCWVFVKVVNELAEVEDVNTIAAQMTANGWSAVSGVEGVYAYEAIAEGGEDIKVFESFSVKGDVDETALAMFADKTIAITAYAVQAEGFDTAAEAWTAANFQ